MSSRRRGSCVCRRRGVCAALTCGLATPAPRLRGMPLGNGNLDDDSAQRHVNSDLGQSHPLRGCRIRSCGGICRSRPARWERASRWLSLTVLGVGPQIQRGRDLFELALRELGYVEGQNVAIEYRWAEGKDERLPRLAAELVHSAVDVIVAAGGVPSARAAQQATRTIPIVLGGAVDPVGAGLVASLVRPGATSLG